ncbi:Ctr copper transporter [Diaporthe sp. PMI_573]|nr:Ctr copper transporter [Diaporthaceae sp. PMI_573]
MLWNWHTIGACFITPQWQIATSAAMVGTCFGVIFLVMALEGLRRSAKQFDRYIVQKHREAAEARYHQVSPTAPADASNPVLPAPVTAPTPTTDGESGSSAPFRPNVWQQMIRALFHAAQFTVAYFIMMLAMNYNGYIIISILVGAYLGAFLFSWETLWEGPRANTSVSEEPTICCS